MSDTSATVANVEGVVAAWNRRDAARQILEEHVGPWCAATTINGDDHATAAASFVMACEERVFLAAPLSVSLYNDVVANMCALLRRAPPPPPAKASKPKVTAAMQRRIMLDSMAKLTAFVISWIDTCVHGTDQQTLLSDEQVSSSSMGSGIIDFSLESIYLAVIGKYLEVKGSMCRTPNCGNPKMLLVSVTMRAGDEGMATIYFCTECGTLDKKIKT